MSIPLVFQGKFTEKYFKTFHLPQIQLQPLDGPFMNLLPYFFLWKLKNAGTDKHYAQDPQVANLRAVSLASQKTKKQKRIWVVLGCSTSYMLVCKNVQYFPVERFILHKKV